MSNPADCLVDAHTHIEDLKESALRHVRHLAETRRALRNVLESVELVAGSLPPGKETEALSAAARDAGVILNR